MHLGLYLTSMIQASPVRDLVALGRLAEDLGFDDLCMGEHIVAADAKPTWAPRAPHAPTEIFPEPLTTFAALAAGVTQLYCPLRAPQTLAEAAPILEKMARAFEPYRR